MCENKVPMTGDVTVVDSEKVKKMDKLESNNPVKSRKSQPEKLDVVNIPQNE